MVAGPGARRVLGGAAVVVVGGLAACGSHPAATPSTSTTASRPAVAPSAGGTPAPAASTSVAAVAPAALPELPRGGRAIFPTYRLVGFAGAPGSTAFGRLGIGRIDDRVAEIEKLARSYGDGRQVLPVLELIAVVAQHFPGDDGEYRVRVDDSVIADYLAAARRHHALLLLNVQPGRAAFLDEVKGLARWLREPDVGLALDPEWSVHGSQVPGRVFGSTTGAVIDSVSAWLDALVRARDLPQKALVVHQLNPGVVRGFEQVHRRAGIALIKSVDGIGSAGAKITTWKRLVKGLPAQIHPGFKLFFEEDRAQGPLMTPAQVLALTPRPEYVLYE